MSDLHNFNHVYLDHSEQRMELLSEIKERGLESLSYVLFDEHSSQAYAFHLFYDNNKFKINARDEGHMS